MILSTEKSSKDKARSPRVAIYARVSTEEQAENGFSIRAQIERLELACKVIGGIPLPPYVDDGYSGKDLNRPQIKRLINDARERKFDIVLVYKLDRLSRRLSDLLAFRDKMEAVEIGLSSATEPFDTTNPVGKLLFNMLGSFAQFERELIAERTKLGLRRRAKEGKWNSVAPFGYRIKADGILEPRPEERTFALRVFKLFLNHNLGATLIARRMRQEDLTTRRKGKWSRTTVWKMLVNPVYAGLHSVDGKLTTSLHEGIITKKEHVLIQDKLDTRSPVTGRTNLSPNILTGLIKCGRCGSMMSTGKGKGNYYYACTKSNNPECPMPWLPAHPLEEAVLEDLRTISRMPSLIDKGLRNLRAGKETATRDLIAERISLEKQFEKVDRTKDKKVQWMLENLPQGPVAEEVQRQIQTQLDSISGIKRRQLEIAARLEAAGTDDTKVETIANCLKHFTQLFTRMETGQKRVLIQSVINEVVVRGKDEINVVFAIPVPSTSQPQPIRRRGGPLNENRPDFDSWIPVPAMGSVHRPAYSGVTEGT